jgi:hypothetical protein
VELHGVLTRRHAISHAAERRARCVWFQCRIGDGLGIVCGRVAGPAVRRGAMTDEIDVPSDRAERPAANGISCTSTGPGDEACRRARATASSA